MNISEISGGDVGSLAGLGVEPSQATRDAFMNRTSGSLVPVSTVKAAAPARLLVGAGGAPVVIQANKDAALHQSDIEQGKVLNADGSVSDSAGNMIVDSEGRDVSGQVVTYGSQQSGGSFIDNLMAAVRANPAVFAAAAALLTVGVIILLPKLRARMQGSVQHAAPVQTMGLGAAPKRKRKSRKSKKA